MFFRYPIHKIKDNQKRYVNTLNRYLFTTKHSLEYVDCALCRSDKKYILFKNDRYGNQYQTVMCKKCGLIYSSPRFSESANTYFYMSDIYRNIYGNEDIISGYESFYFLAKQYNFDSNIDQYKKFSFMDFLLQSGINFKTVCEIGAGGGTNLVPLISLNKDCVGYEYYDKLVKFGNQKGIKLICGGHDQVKGQYDLILLCHVLEHFINPEEQLKKIALLTKRYLLVEVPGIDKHVPSIQNAHQFYFSINTLRKIAAKSGFKCLKYKIFKENDFMIALFEKDQNALFDYNYKDEIKQSLLIINKYRIRYLIYNIFKEMHLGSLYNIFYKIKSHILYKYQ